MPVYEKCKVFTCKHTCNLPVIIDSEVYLTFPPTKLITFCVSYESPFAKAYFIYLDVFSIHGILVQICLATSLFLSRNRLIMGTLEMKAFLNACCYDLLQNRC